MLGYLLCKLLLNVLLAIVYNEQLMKLNETWVHLKIMAILLPSLNAHKKVFRTEKRSPQITKTTRSGPAGVGYMGKKTPPVLQTLIRLYKVRAFDAVLTPLCHSACY